MIATCDYGVFLCLLNDIEYSVFLKDGNIDNETLERLTKCTSESCQNLTGETVKLLKSLSTGEYHSIFNGQFVKGLLGKDLDDIADYGLYLKEQVTIELLSCKSEEDCYLRQLTLLMVGVSCLQLVVQQNWTGPPLEDNPKTYLPSCFQNEKKTEILRNQTFDYLRKDSEDVFVLAEFLEFFLIARIILVECRYLLSNMKTQAMWEIRCILIHQQLLEDPSSCLKDEALSAIEKFNMGDNNLPRELMCRICVESAYIFLQYYEHDKTKEQLDKAQNSEGLELYLGGALGKKTKFQQIDYIQLTANAKVKTLKGETSSKTDKPDYLPKDVMLDDDVLLDKPKFTHPDEILQEKLEPLHLATILAICFYKQKSQARHELLVEELLANIMLILSQPQVWTIQTVALLLRSKYEKKSSRKKERSMLQVQQLVDQYHDSHVKLSQRLEYFYSVPVPARWNLERELAALYQELSITKSALEIYQRWHLWEDVINCYITLGRYEKAETIVREQLREKETPKLWCLLGDVTKNEEYYHRAWDVSKGRSARAQRSLGYLYLRDKKFADCIPCFQKSLEINSLQENVWFSLGCAAMLTGNLEMAAKSYHWCVSMNPDNSEAWNNLSSVYIKTNRKDRAFKTLQEALKSNYENWHVWENFLVVSTDVGAFEEVISALHRLMDLKEKYCDVEVLRILVRSVVTGKEDRKGLPASRLKPALKKLMGRLTSQITNNSDVWKLYSDLYKDGEKAEEKEKFLQYLVKAHRVKMQTPGWEKSQKDIEDVVKLTLELSQAYYEASEVSEVEATRVTQRLSSSKLNLRGVITKLKNNCNPVTGQLDSSSSELLTKLEEELEKTLNFITTLKSR